MPRSFTFATITEYQAAKSSANGGGAIYAELVSSGIKSGSCVSKITATGDVFIDSINPFVTPELGQEGDTLYYNSSEDTYRFLRAGNTTWDADSYGQVYIDLAKIPSGFSVVAPYTDIFNYKQTDENIGSGKASMTKILGNSLAWNQLCANGDFVNTNGWSCESGSIAVNNNTLVFTPSSTDTSVVFTDNTRRDYHKMYFGLYVKTENAASCIISDRYGSNYSSTYLSVPANTWVRYTGIVSLDGSGSYKNIGPFRLRVKAGSGVVNIKKWIVVDLTLMFGSGNEPTNPAEFEALCPKLYYAYNQGQLLSNKAKAIEFVGFNQWDEEWELGAINGGTGAKYDDANAIRSKNYISIFPSSIYCFRHTQGINVATYYYDANKNFISSGYPNAGDVAATFTTPSNAAYLLIKIGAAASPVTEYARDICINLSGNRNGQYEPYKKVVLPLPNLDQIKVYSHNIWDEELEQGYIDQTTGENISGEGVRSKNMIKVLPSTTYYIKTINSGVRIFQYTANGAFLDATITVTNATFTTRSDAGYIRFQSGAAGSDFDFCINLSSSFDGQYEPHGILTMEGGLKSAGSVRDEIVGNKYIKRVGVVDLGNLGWTPGSVAGLFLVMITGQKTVTTGTKPNDVCGKYIVGTTIASSTNAEDKTIYQGNANNYIFFKDTAFSGYTGTQVAEALMGVMLYYELATPIEYEIYSPTKMPFNWKYRVSEYHTKKMLPENGENPTSAPFACEIKKC